jgi:zinc transport system substrate-binding protein
MRSLIWATLMTGILATPALADLKVMVSIKPLHSLVASVMQGAGQPGLIVNGAGSPHTYQLKPSDAAALQDAEVIFWFGHELEAFLEKPLDALGSNATTIAMLDQKAIDTLPVREGNGFDPHEDHAEEAAHMGSERDGHVWLDPVLGQTIVKIISEILANKDPQNAKLYTQNASTLIMQLQHLDRDLKNQTMPLKEKNFITFHDAYQYFERRYGLKSSGSITIHPENPPGAAGIKNLKERLNQTGVSCIFSEPQFDSKLIDVISEGSTVQSATLDPLGATLEPGPDLYPTLLRNLANDLNGCLSRR